MEALSYFHEKKRTFFSEKGALIVGNLFNKCGVFTITGATLLAEAPSVWLTSPKLAKLAWQLFQSMPALRTAVTLGYLFKPLPPYTKAVGAWWKEIAVTVRLLVLLSGAQQIPSYAICSLKVRCKNVAQNLSGHSFSKAFLLARLAAKPSADVNYMESTLDEFRL